MALLVLFTATQIILAALMLALRTSAVGRAWGAGQVLACAPSAAHGACAQSQHQGSEDDLRGGEQDKQCHHGSARI